jgi:hypothetical protein
MQRTYQCSNERRIKGKKFDQRGFEQKLEMAMGHIRLHEKQYFGTVAYSIIMPVKGSHHRHGFAFKCMGENCAKVIYQPESNDSCAMGLVTTPHGWTTEHFCSEMAKAIATLTAEKTPDRELVPTIKRDEAVDLVESMFELPTMKEFGHFEKRHVIDAIVMHMGHTRSIAQGIYEQMRELQVIVSEPGKSYLQACKEIADRYASISSPPKKVATGSSLFDLLDAATDGEQKVVHMKTPRPATTLPPLRAVVLEQAADELLKKGSRGMRLPASMLDALDRGPRKDMSRVPQGTGRILPDLSKRSQVETVHTQVIQPPNSTLATQQAPLEPASIEAKLAAYKKSHTTLNAIRNRLAALSAEDVRLGQEIEKLTDLQRVARTQLASVRIELDDTRLISEAQKYMELVKLLE